MAKVAFTGSTEVGRGIAEAAAGTIKRVTLELGGKSANVVFADADLEQAAAAAPMAVFGNAGQDCCARSRILVERSALDRFMDALVDRWSRLNVGDPLDEATQMGPLISASQRERRRVLRGRRRAGRDPRRGARRARLLVPADGAGARVERPTAPRVEEIFGPVACVIPFADEAEAVRSGQRHDLRALRLDLDPRRREGSAGRARARHRRRLDQLEHLRAGEHAVRRLQAVRSGPRAGPARARPLHRGEERLLRNGCRNA